MPEKCERTIAEMLEDDELMTEAIRKGIREELLTHARAGNPVATSVDGKVVWLSPAEIYRRLGYAVPPEVKHPSGRVSGLAL